MLFEQTPTSEDKSSGDNTKSSWEELAIDAALTELKSAPNVGLSHEEAARRLTSYGRNTIEQEAVRPVLLFAKKFWSPSAWMLEAILVLSAVLHKMADVWVTSGLLLLNAVISLSQELRAHSAVEALKEKLQVVTRTLRQGEWGMVTASELVPGDIVRLRMGDFVPADVKLIDGNLAIDQSSLTGESETLFPKLQGLSYLPDPCSNAANARESLY